MITHRSRPAVLLGAVVLGAGPSVRAQCVPDWLPQSSKAHTDGIGAVTVLGGDIVVWGAFRSPAGGPVNDIARWDGAAWHPLESGIQGAVYAMSPYARDLIVSGSIASVGGIAVNKIAGWNGEKWYALGEGVNAPYPYPDVQALAEYNGDLYAGGDFTLAGGQPAVCIARWDGASWSPVGGGASGPVRDLVVHDGGLIAGGPFILAGPQLTSIGRWDGQSWHAMNIYCGNCSIDALAVHAGDLFAAVTVEFGYQQVIRWNGSDWDWLSVTNEWDVAALASYRGELIAGGRVSSVFGPPGMSAIHRWNGATWVPVGGGIPALDPQGVYALTTYQDVLHVGGNFRTAGGLPSPNWARWGCACYADCNNSGGLSIADFTCFQAQFIQSHPYSDCNSDNAQTIADFTCFQGKFVAGCP